MMRDREAKGVLLFSKNKLIMSTQDKTSLEGYV